MAKQIFRVRGSEDIKIKDKLKKWLLADELLRIKELEGTHKELENSVSKAIDLLDKAYGNYAKAEDVAENTAILADDCRKLMNNICDVGVDVARDEYHSWAVVCIHGKMDFMKFVPLNHSDIREVAQFLKRFEYSKRVVDSPLAYSDMIEDLIARL